MKKIFKKIYEFIPFKRSLYTSLRNVISLPKKLQPYFYFTGKFSTYIDNNSFLMYNYGYQYHVENELFWGGVKNGWEKESINLWIKLCKIHNSVLDIGANTGVFSLIARNVNPQANIVAFEPMPKIYDKLNYNIKLNHYNITTSLYALSNYSGKAIIYPTNLEHVYSVTVNKKREDINLPIHELEIKTVRLDEFILQENIKNVDLIKIDVESHEPEVLEGMGIYLKQFKPTFLIEIQTTDIAEKIEKLIDGCNYIYFNIDENTGIMRVQKLSKSSYFNFLICSENTAKNVGLIN